MTGKKIGKQAIVIGAGMAGLAAAGALADYFENVLILERDILPRWPVPRNGTGQSRHLHVLLPGGHRILSELFPHFERDLIGAGSVPLRVFRDIRMEIGGIGALPQRDFGWSFHCGTRPLIELVTRRQVERLTNVTFRAGRPVSNISYASAGGMTATLEGSDDPIRADLVVDASGRAAPTLAFLRSAGHPPPEEVTIGIDLHYTTTSFAIPKNAPTDWKGVGSWADAPESSRAGFLMPMEGNRWIVTFSGHWIRSPDDHEGFMEHARQLHTQSIYNVIKDAERISGFERYGFPANRWRRFDRLKEFPRGLLPIGDSICRFNPVYGQGMSVAAQQARLLKQLLKRRATMSDPLNDLAAAFFSESLPFIDAAWNMSAIPDFVYPETRGERPADFEKRMQYTRALLQATIRHPVVQRAHAQVQQLLQPPSILQEPDIDGLIQAELKQIEAGTTASGA
jgi:2-polyprenyl-6-methoxyphenol hydroxylase-like FAD-dependent oxidoreductase